jgi:DNA-binding transcriptional MerR regulator
MAPEGSFTLAEIARRLDVPQHRLIHLCERGVVVPDVQEAAGRGSSRVFSARNVLELSVALRLREMMLPVTAVGAIVHVLRGIEVRLQEDLPNFELVRSLREPRSPELRVILSDGKTIYFSLAAKGKERRLFGGIPLEQVTNDAVSWGGSMEALSSNGTRESSSLGGPEPSQFARLELSVTAVARSLPLP